MPAIEQAPFLSEWKIVSRGVLYRFGVGRLLRSAVLRLRSLVGRLLRGRVGRLLRSTVALLLDRALLIASL